MQSERSVSGKEILKISLYFLFLTLVFFSRNILFKKSYTPFSLLNIWDDPPRETEYGMLAQMDALVIFYSHDSLYNEMLKKGEILKWSPYVFSGYPIYANGHSSFHNPFRLLFNFLFPPVFARDFTIFFHMVLSGIFSFLFLREMGFSFYPSLFGGTAWEFCAHNTALVEWLWGAMASAYLPMLLFFFLKLLNTGKGYYFFLTASAFTLSLMCGNLQWSLYTGMIWLSFYALHVYLRLREKDLKGAVMITVFFTGAFIMGFLLSSIEILPTLELLKNSVIQRESYSYQEIKTDFLTKFSLFITLFYPRLTGSPFDQINLRNIAILSYYLFNGYIGILPLFFMVSGIVLFWRKAEVKLFTFLLILSWLVALRTPLVVIFLKIPLINKLFHDRILFISSFFGIILATSGLTGFFSEENIRLKSIITFSFPCLFVITVTVFFITSLKAISSSWLSPFNTAINIPFLLLIASTLLLSGKLRGMKDSHFKLLSALILILDLVPLGMISNTCDSPKSLEIVERLKNEIEIKPGERIAGLTPNLSVILKIPSMEGYDSVYPQWYFKSLYPALHTTRMRWQVLYNITPNALLKLLGVKFVIPNGNLNPVDNPLMIKDMKPLKSAGKLRIYEVEGTLPRVFVPEKFVLMSEKECAEFLHRAGFNPLEFLILVEIPEEFVPQGMKGTAEIISYTPHEVLIKADMETDGFLVLSDTYYPGWKAYVDGRETRIYRAYSFLRAVKVSKGKHEIVFRFSPSIYLAGKIITALSAVLLIVLCFLTFPSSPYMDIPSTEGASDKPASRAWIISITVLLLLTSIMTIKWWMDLKEFRKSRWYFYRGVLESQMEPETAKRFFEKALSFKIYPPQTYLFMGKLLHEMGKKEEAIKMVEKAREFFPLNIETNMLLLSLYKEAGEEHRVKELWKYVERNREAIINSLLENGFNLLGSGDVRAATKAFLSVTILDPKNHRAYYGLSIAYSMEGNLEEALKAIRSALALSPATKTYTSFLERLLDALPPGREE